MADIAYAKYTMKHKKRAAAQIEKSVATAHEPTPESVDRRERSMAGKKPNIIECDGIIIRGPDGKKRAEIAVYDTGRLGEIVSLFMYGNTDMGVPEPAFCVHVDAAGQTEFRIGYAGVDERGEHTVDALRIHSGDIEREPYIQYFGSRGNRRCSPTHVVRGRHVGRWADFVDAVLEAAREYSTRYGVGEEDPVELMDEVAAVLQFEQETRGATP